MLVQCKGDEGCFRRSGTQVLSLVKGQLGTCVEPDPFWVNPLEK